jgi:hypothetical protein
VPRPDLFCPERSQLMDDLRPKRHPEWFAVGGHLGWDDPLVQKRSLMMISKELVLSAVAPKAVQSLTSATADAGRVRMGAGCRVRATQTADTGKVRMGAGCRGRTQAAGAAQTADAGKVRMGAGCRVRTQAAGAAQTADAGKVRVGAGCRVRTQAVGAVQTVDGGKVRMGAGCRIRLLAH